MYGEWGERSMRILLIILVLLIIWLVPWDSKFGFRFKYHSAPQPKEIDGINKDNDRDGEGSMDDEPLPSPPNEKSPLVRDSDPMDV
jgi:hypothetical protein